MTEASQQALAILRDPGQFQWYVIPLFALVVYVYAQEFERQNWSLVFAENKKSDSTKKVPVTGCARVIRGIDDMCSDAWGWRSNKVGGFV